MKVNNLHFAIFLFLFSFMYSQNRVIVTEGMEYNTIPYTVQNIGSYIGDDYADIEGITLELEMQLLPYGNAGTF